MSSKYRNVPCVAHGRKFASILEKNRYEELLLALKASGPGQIRDLRLQVRFQLLPAVRLRGASRLTPACDYVADFCYDELTSEGWVSVIEDVKSAGTKDIRVYKTKRHMMKSLLGLDIRETQPRGAR